jgi:prepilin-type N-terminal cleavage/methylation domain-containing protein
MFKFFKIKFHKKKGFTLIELLIAIAIIVVLSSLTLANYSTSRMKARDAQRMNDIQQIQTALEMYYNYNKSYPEESHSGCYDGWETSCDVAGNFIDALRTSGTIAKVPFDPLNNSTYLYAYYNYPAGSNGCSFPHAVLAIHKFESSQNPNIGVSAKCPADGSGRNWYPEFDYSILLPE